jgi:hypothetical protein
VNDTTVMGQYGSHSCRSGDAGAVATTTSASAPKQAIVISTLTGRKIRLIERVDNVVGPLTQNRRATGSWRQDTLGARWPSLGTERSSSFKDLGGSGGWISSNSARSERRARARADFLELIRITGTLLPDSLTPVGVIAQ